MASNGPSQSAANQADDLIASLELLDPVYQRRRKLLDGPEKTYLAFVTEHADRVQADLHENALDRFLEDALADCSKLRLLTLNTAALIALRNGEWKTVRTLAGEVVARDHHDLMAQRLIDAALQEITDLNTDTTQWLRGRRCDAPFRQMETRVNGTVHFCCSAWQPTPIGRFDTDDRTTGFWNSDKAREIRRSVSEGDFTHCSHWHCPAIADRRLPEAQPETTERDLHVSCGPKRVILSHDRSCNIMCPSCRKARILMDHKSSERLDNVFRKSLLPLLTESDDIKVTGSGDPFGSRHFRNVLKELCAGRNGGRRIQLHTNGLLANERNWDDLNLWENVSSVWVSVDAAVAPTYSILRRGGDFDQLLKALIFLGDLQRSGAIDSLRLDFVVQYENFGEMGDFVDLAHRVGASHVYFLRLRNWGHIDPIDFRQQDICSPDHPEHADLLTRLRDPRLDQANVDLGSVATLRRAAGASAYYD